MPIRIAIVGLGKIARDQHLPAIAGDANFSLMATVSPNESGLAGVSHYKNLKELLETGPKVDAVILCTPPHVRYGLASQALSHGAHVFLEKPPGATVSEVSILERQADDLHLTLFAGWHSRFASGVAPAQAWLANREIRAVSIVWREDVRAWHPGQDWVWEPGGLGVFDPGINALSIATRILPRKFFLRDATLVFPVNRSAPIAASMRFTDPAGAEVSMDLDWRQTGPQSWDIKVETDAGACTLSRGGAVLNLPGVSEKSADREYPGLYKHFAKLIYTRRSDVDSNPLQLVADAFLCGRREFTDAFDW